ncbi:hypothetical protein AAC387_Pa07g3915 [Persea americana]
MSTGNCKALRLYSDTHAALPLLAWAVNSRFPVFLHSEWWRSGSCSFTAARIDGKVDFPVILLCERRNTGSCSFTAALFGGKVDFRNFLHSERRKTGNCSYTGGTYGDNI